MLWQRTRRYLICLRWCLEIYHLNIPSWCDWLYFSCHYWTLKIKQLILVNLLSLYMDKKDCGLAWSSLWKSRFANQGAQRLAKRGPSSLVDFVGHLLAPCVLFLDLYPFKNGNWMSFYYDDFFSLLLYALLCIFFFFFFFRRISTHLSFVQILTFI